MSNTIKKPLVKKVKKSPAVEAVETLNASLAPFSIKINEKNEITTDISSNFNFDGKTLKQIQLASQKALNIIKDADDEHLISPVQKKRQPPVDSNWFARRLSAKAKREYGTNISAEDFERLIQIVFEEMAELLLNGRSVEVLPIGILKASSKFRKSPIQGVPNVDNWFETRLKLEPNRRFLNTLKIYELTRRTPEERALYKNALLELKFYQESAFKNTNPNLKSYLPPPDDALLEVISEEIIDDENNPIVITNKD